MKINLIDFDRDSLRSYFSKLGEVSYRADQVIKWMHQLGEIDFAKMTNLSKTLRQKLPETAEITLPEILHTQTANDGTCKWVLKLFDGNCIETVFIPDNDRGTLCISSQVGCVLNCSFCSTGKQGFSRNLTMGEIIGQLWVAIRHLSASGTNREHVITNVVIMGMGEPLFNFYEIVKAINLMLDDFAYGLSKYRVTLSTSGVVPAMLKLKKVSDVSLAVSLHAPNNVLRNQLMPINKKYPLESLIPVCRNYYGDLSKRVVTFEYIMLDGVNDQECHVRELIALLHDVPCKINLIPFNQFSLTNYRCSSMETIERFQHVLQQAGFNVILRRTRGQEIAAACGQLVGDVQDRTGRHEKWLGRSNECAGISTIQTV